MNVYEIALLEVGLIGLLGFLAFRGFLIYTERNDLNLAERTRKALEVAATSNLAFFVCIIVTIFVQGRESWFEEVRFLPWIISGVPIALILGYIARQQSTSLLYAIERPRLRLFLQYVTVILILDWFVTLLAGLAFAEMPGVMPRISEGSLGAIFERIPLLGAELLCLTVVSVVFLRSSGPRTPSYVLRTRNKLFFVGTSCWILIELVEMSFPLNNYWLNVSAAISTNAMLTLVQALLLLLSIVAWMLGFIKHRGRTELDDWRARFLEWSRLREMLGVARAKIRFLSSGLLVTHEYHLNATAKSLGLSERELRKAVLVLHMTCVLSETAKHGSLGDFDLRPKRADLLKCVTLHDHLLRSSAVTEYFEFHSTTSGIEVTYSLEDDLLHKALRPALSITQVPMRTDFSRYPLWVQLAAVSAAYAGLLEQRSRQDILESKALDKKALAAYALSIRISLSERLNGPSSRTNL